MMDVKDKFSVLTYIPLRSPIVFIILLFSLYIYIRKTIEYRRDVEYGRSHGCEPATYKLVYRWPLALDVMKKGFQAGRQKKLLALFTEYFEQLGSTPELTILGGTGYATKDPENIEAILSTQFHDFHLGHRSMAMKSMIGEGVFTQDGAEWKSSRELLRKQFARMQYQNLEGFRGPVENLVNKLKSSAGVVDLQPFFYRLTLVTTITMILGQPLEIFDHEIGDQFSRAFDKASLITATRVRLGDLYFLYAPKGFFKSCTTVKQYLYQFVKDALGQEALSQKNEAQDPNEMSFIANLYTAYRDLGLTRDQVTNVLIAGRDTTAATLSYAIRLLVQNPTVLMKLREEVIAVAGNDKDVTRSHIQRMTYLQQVLKETLRLYPPVPLNSRFCKKTTTLPRGGGADGRSPILVRKGMPVAYSVYHLQRRADLYGPDPLIFRPERWGDPELENIGWGYLPFNGGPRLCLGKDFGSMLASYGIVRLIQEFPDMKLAPGEVVEEPGLERQHLTLTLSNAGGCKVLFS